MDGQLEPKGNPKGAKESQKLAQKPQEAPQGCQSWLEGIPKDAWRTSRAPQRLNFVGICGATAPQTWTRTFSGTRIWSLPDPDRDPQQDQHPHA